VKKLLSGMIPVCVNCKKMRDDGGYWKQIESYIEDHSEAKLNHAVCPDCFKKLCPELYDKNERYCGNLQSNHQDIENEAIPFPFFLSQFC
tara:strand:+ start:209 stop:478 length:270 start_codon:yes stop_codon:yes gene_type:complete